MLDLYSDKVKDLKIDEREKVNQLTEILIIAQDLKPTHDDFFIFGSIIKFIKESLSNVEKFTKEENDNLQYLV